MCMLACLHGLVPVWCDLCAFLHSRVSVREESPMVVRKI